VPCAAANHRGSQGTRQRQDGDTHNPPKSHSSTSDPHPSLRQFVGCSTTACPADWPKRAIDPLLRVQLGRGGWNAERTVLAKGERAAHARKLRIARIECIDRLRDQMVARILDSPKQVSESVDMIQNGDAKAWDKANCSVGPQGK